MSSANLLLGCVITLTITGSALSTKHAYKHASYASILSDTTNIHNAAYSEKNKYKIDFQTYKTFHRAFDNNGLFDPTVKHENLLKATKISRRCLNDTFNIQKGFKKKEEWAFRVFDAFGKIPSGVLDGDFTWLGNYDTCIYVSKNPRPILGIKAPFNGKYCTSSLTYNTEDKSLRLPSVTYALCMPDTCNEEEIQILMNTYIKQKLGNQGNITLDNVYCKAKATEYDKLAIAGLVFLVVYGLLVGLATIYDVVRMFKSEEIPVQLENCEEPSDSTENNKPSEGTPLIEKDLGQITRKEPGLAGKLLLCFSMYSNGKKLLNLEQSITQLSSLNGMRFLSISWVVLGHAYYYLVPWVSNLGPVVPEHLLRVSSQAVLEAPFAVDTFFAMSGFLVSFFILRELKKTNGKLNWLMLIFHRFWRLTPAYLILLFLIVSLSKYVTDGPLWPDEGFETEACAKTWWYNVLYINNFVSYQPDVCMGWSWYLANDMQFFLISPLLLILLFRFEVIGLITIAVSTVACMVTTGLLSKKYHLIPGIPMEYTEGENEVGTVFLKFYVKPYVRIGPYLLGILTGYILNKTGFTIKLKKVFVLLGWALAIFFGMILVYGLFKKNGYFGHLSDIEGYMYQATSRVIWGACICWVIFACATGNGGFINTLLSWKPFVLLGRLSYCIYLVHPMVISFANFNKRLPIYYTDHVGIYIFLGQLTMSTMAAFVMSLFLETPMMSLEKVLLRRKGAAEK